MPSIWLVTEGLGGKLRAVNLKEAPSAVRWGLFFSSLIPVLYMCFYAILDSVQYLAILVLTAAHWSSYYRLDGLGS